MLCYTACDCYLHTLCVNSDYFIVSADDTRRYGRCSQLDDTPVLAGEFGVRTCVCTCVRACDLVDEWVWMFMRVHVRVHT